MKNKVYGYGRQSVDEADIESVVSILKSDYLTCGPAVQRFEQEICNYTGAKYCVSVSNATAGLHLAALAAGLREGDEAITSPITFLSSANCARFCGATVRFADIDPNTANISPSEIERKLNKKTKVVIPVHFAGQSCDMEKIRNVTQGKGVTLIEDAAHAFGSDYKNKKVGSCAYSDMTVFSFHPVKNFTTGEGGAITTNREDLYKKLLLLRAHGMSKPENLSGTWKYEMSTLGFNYRLTDIQAALGISQLKKIEKFKDRRRKIVDFYNKELGLDHLQEMEFSNSCFHLYPILIHNRDDFYFRAKEENLNLQVHYIPVHTQPYYQKFGFRWGDFPFAENYYMRTISLPLYPSLEDDDLQEIVSRVKKLLKI